MIPPFGQFRQFLMWLAKYSNGNSLFLNKMSSGTTLIINLCQLFRIRVAGHNNAGFDWPEIATS